MTSCNSEILTIQHLKSEVPKLEVLLFHYKKASSGKQADVREMFKKASKNVCSTIAAPSPDPLSPTPSTLLLQRLRKTQNRTMMTLNRQIEVSKQNTLIIWII